MNRATSLRGILLCAVLLTAVASASLLTPLLPPDASASRTKPQRWKGRRISKYVAKLRSTKINGGLVGDKGASGKYVVEAVKYSGVNSYMYLTLDVVNIKSGGKAPAVTISSSCAVNALGDTGLGFLNITNRRSGRRKRYSFTYSSTVGPNTGKEIRSMVADKVLPAPRFVTIGHDTNFMALCGKFKKAKK
ncbi:unnamed protein product [Closterium sp. Yama58-4]|nr:unnamed protein product [Closterium sp. Yama58-4]